MRHSTSPPLARRTVSFLPLSPLLEQAVGLFYALSVGASILYVRSRNPRLIFEALRAHRVTSMIVVPQVLDLFSTPIAPDAAKSVRPRPSHCLRPTPPHLPLLTRPP